MPAIAIAVFCVLLSRATGFKPGYLYGFVGGLVFLGAREPDDRTKGRLVLVAAGCLMVLSLAAWSLAIPVTNAVEAGSSWLQVIRTICIAAFVAGLQGLVFRLVPLSFMAGGTLIRWNKWIWGALFALGVFLFWHVLLNPDSTYGKAFTTHQREAGDRAARLLDGRHGRHLRVLLVDHEAGGGGRSGARDGGARL